MIDSSSLEPAPRVQAVSRILRQLMTSLDRASHVSTPFDFWLFSNILPERAITDIVAAPPNPGLDGRRESNNSSRIFFSRKTRYAIRFAELSRKPFNAALVVDAVWTDGRPAIGRGKAQHRILPGPGRLMARAPSRHFCQELQTLLIDLSDDPNLSDAGADIYDDSPAHKLIASAPYAKNKGLVFALDANSWHGLSKRPIRGLRRSLIVNFVSSKWRRTEELAFPSRPPAETLDRRAASIVSQAGNACACLRVRSAAPDTFLRP